MSTDVTESAENGLELTERELAIAAGQDPDAIEVEAPDAGEAREASEAQGSSETTPPVVEVDSESGKEAGASEDAEGREAAESAVSEPESWINDDIRGLAGSYGIKDDELESFSGADEFRRAAVFFERSRTKPQPQTQPGGGDVRQQGQAPKQKPAEQQQEQRQEGEQGDETEALLKKLADAGYDDDVVSAFRFTLEKQKRELETLRPAVQQFQTFQERIKHAEQQRIANDFHNAADQLDEERFGRSLDKEGRPAPLSAQHNANRAKLWEARAAVAQHLNASGGQYGLSDPVVMKRAEYLAFGEEILERERRERLDRIAEQSRRRRPASGRPQRTAPVADQDDPLQAVINDPEVVSLYESMQV